jgi:hypothetical protein
VIYLDFLADDFTHLGAYIHIIDKKNRETDKTHFSYAYGTIFLTEKQ